MQRCTLHNIVLWVLYTLLSVGVVPTLAEEPYDWAARPSRTTTIYFTTWPGLGNRLRSLSSAATLARTLNANFVLHWPRAPKHCQATYDELFEYPNFELGEMPKFCRVNYDMTFHDYPFKLPEVLQRLNWTRHDGQDVLCIQGGGFGFYLEPWPTSSQWFFKALRPVKPIQDIINRFKAEADWATHAWIGVHIRQGDRLDLALKAKEEHGVDTSQYNATTLLNLVWPVDQFVTVMRTVESQHSTPGYEVMLPCQALRFFVATESREAYHEVERSFPEGMVRSLNKTLPLTHNVDNRGLFDLHAAVADLMLLSNTRVLIGSYGSSFSSVAYLMNYPWYIGVRAVGTVATCKPTAGGTSVPKWGTK